MEIRSGYVDVNGTRLYYEEAGRGFPLVLVHARISDLTMWEEQFTVFARQYRTIRYDLRGYGSSENGAGKHNHVADLFGLLKALKVEPAFLVGCALGASVAVDLAIEHPEMVAALVLINPALAGYTYETLDGPIEFLPADQFANQQLNLIRNLVMVITGESQSTAADESVRMIELTIPNIKKARLTGTALLPNIGRPAQFNRILLTYLEWAETELKVPRWKNLANHVNLSLPANPSPGS